MKYTMARLGLWFVTVSVLLLLLFTPIWAGFVIGGTTFGLAFGLDASIEDWQERDGKRIHYIRR